MASKRMDRRYLLAGIGGALAGSILSGAARAGDLKPPPGPITPTGKSMTDLYNRIARTDAGIAAPWIPIESLPGSDTVQRIISAPGSYCLTQNMVGESGKHGIQVDADNVDIDLQGFHLFGFNDPVGTVGSGAAIRTDRQNVTVYDGSFIGWDVSVQFQAATRFILMDLTSIGAVRGGFFLGSHGQADDCDSYGSPVGFSATGERTLVEDCGVWTCAIGFQSTGTRNLLLSNCATECQTPFEIGPGNAFGPLVDVSGVGDVSAVAHSEHPGANYIY